MSEHGNELLRQAIQNGLMAVVTPVEGSTGRILLRLAPMAATEGASAMAASVEEGRAGQIDALIQGKAPVQVAIKLRWAIISFQTVILSQQRRLLSRQVSLRMPRKIDVEQRRRAPRERVPPEVQVHAWLTDGGPNSAAEPVPAEVWDLSATGVCICCRADHLPASLKPGNLMSVTLSHNGIQQHLTTRFRHTQSLPNGGIRLGLEFDPHPCETADSATANALTALIDLLAQLRIKRTSEQFIKQTLGLAG